MGGGGAGLRRGLLPIFPLPLFHFLVVFSPTHPANVGFSLLTLSANSRVVGGGGGQSGRVLCGLVEHWVVDVVVPFV